MLPSFEPIPVGLERLYVVEKTHEGTKTYLADPDGAIKRLPYELATSCCKVFRGRPYFTPAYKFVPWTTEALSMKPVRTIFGGAHFTSVPKDRYSQAECHV